MDLFVKATKAKFRYQTPVGLVSTEDLWDLPLDQLDRVAILLNRSIKSLEEESFLEPQTRDSSELRDKLEVAKTVIKSRLEEERAKKEKALKEIKRQRILEKIEQRQDKALDDLPLEELKAMLAEL